MPHHVEYEFIVPPLVLGIVFTIFAGRIQAIFASQVASMSRPGRAMVGGKEFVESRLYRWLLRLMGVVMIGLAAAYWVWS